VLSPLPQTGRAEDEILAELSDLKKNDIDWRRGRLPHYVWNVDDKLFDLQLKAFELYHVENGLGAKRAFPSVGQMEREILAIAASLQGGGAETSGSVTSGGTESILMAVRAARNQARATRSTDPNRFNI